MVDEKIYIGIIDIEWQRINPDKDVIPHNLKPESNEPHIYIEAQIICYRPSELPKINQMRGAYLYNEESLSTVDFSPHSVCDDYQELKAKLNEFSITDNMPENIEAKLLKYFDDENNHDYLTQYFLYHAEGLDEFIHEIKCKALREKIKFIWDKYFEDMVGG